MAGSLRQKYTEWLATRHAVGVEPFYSSSRCRELLTQIVASPAASMEDWAIKIVAVDDGGDMSMTVWQMLVAEQAKGILLAAGLRVPATSPGPARAEPDAVLAGAA